MKILLTGGTGLIGRQLGKELVRQGHQVLVISRNQERAEQDLPYPCEVIDGDLSRDALRDERLRTVDAVINLAGENVSHGRWASERKRRIYDSRVRGTENLIASLQEMARPRVFISASAIGYYGDQGETTVDEDGLRGQGFLSDVCRDWERVVEITEKKRIWPNTRFVVVRIGLVLSPWGGAMERLLLPFRSGLAGSLGSGQQWMSWIHLQDLVQVFMTALQDSRYKGVVNAVAPESVRNMEFSDQLAAQFGKKRGPRMPASVLKTALGEMAEMLLFSNRVVSKVLRENGFQFHFAELSSALADVCQGYRQGGMIFHSEKYIPSRTIASDKNEIETQLKKGYYGKWNYIQSLEKLGEGTLMMDVVRYQVPFGWMGSLTVGRWVGNRVSKIFRHQRQGV